MRVGLSLFFQNYYDWGRFEAREEEAPIGLDAGVYEDEISLAAGTTASRSWMSRATSTTSRWARA